MSNFKYEDYNYMLSKQEIENTKEILDNLPWVDFLDYFKFMLDEDFNSFEEYLLAELELKEFGNRSNDDIISGMLIVTDNQLNKMLKAKNYYICNAICALSVVKRIFTRNLLDYLSCDETPIEAQNRYVNLLKTMFLEADRLIWQYNFYLKNNEKYTGRNYNEVHSISLHKVLQQTLHGQINYFGDEIYVSILIIKQIIELRIRRAFGILALIDNDNNTIPIDLSKIFNVLKKYSSDITLPVELSSLEKINKWSNVYAHSGKGSFPWHPYFIESFLHQFSLGIMLDDSWAYYNAITINKDTLDKIYSELLSNKPNCKIYSCNPECNIK